LSSNSQEKTDHEDRALAALVRALSGTGHQARVASHPDRDNSVSLTVDALVDLDGTQWAVDHCLLSRDDRIPGARQGTEKRLQEPLEAIARQTGVALSVTYQPHAGPDTAAYCETILDMARAVAVDGQTRYRDDGCTSVAVWPHAPAGEVGLSPFLTMTRDARLSNQIEEGIGPALDRKLAGQLRRAKDAGYPVMLLLDGAPRPGSLNDTIWMTAHPATVRAAVQPHLEAHPGVIDLVWWVPWQADVAQLVAGELPSPA
jgi:hypothetical protein